MKPQTPAARDDDRLRQTKDIYQTVVDLAGQGCSFALATVLQSDGSTPCKTGAKMIIAAEGQNHGTIGGGLVEAEAKVRARQALESGQPVVFDFDLGGPGVQVGLPICGGDMRVLVDPTIAQQRAAYQFALSAQRDRQRGVLVTTISGDEGAAVQVEFVAESSLGSRTVFPERRRTACSLETGNRRNAS